MAVDPPGGRPSGHMACVVQHGAPGMRNALNDLSSPTEVIKRHYGINGYAGYAFDAAAIFAQGDKELVSKGAKFTADKAEKLVLNYFTKCKCFVAGTLIHTKNGLVPIEKIQVGDWVAARSEETGETSYKQVLRLVRNGEKEIIRLRYRQPDGKMETLGVTEEHPFMLEGRRWVNAGALKPGDKIMRLAGGVLTVVSMRHQVIKQHTFNFEVEGFHSYFAGAGGAWVHNSGVDCSLIAGQLKGLVKNAGVSVQKNGLAYNVKLEKELLELHRKMIHFSKVEHAPGATYNGIINRLEDGSRVGLRNDSMIGGATIDILLSTGKPCRFHIQS